MYAACDSLGGIKPKEYRIVLLLAVYIPDVSHKLSSTRFSSVSKLAV